MNKKSSTITNWFLFIFGLIFFLAGLGAGYATIGKMTVKYFSSINWQPVPANISSLKLKKHRSDSSTTNIVKATYTYVYKGNQQKSSSVALSDVSDNIGDYWQKLHKRLKYDQARGRAQAWVNPNNPSEALLDRTFRWSQLAFGSMFLLIFSGFGLGAMWMSMKKVKPIEEVRQEAKINGIKNNESSGFIYLFLFGSPFLLIGLFTFFAVLPDIINKGEYEGLFTLLFVVVGAGIMSFAYINHRRYKLIGPTPLFLNPLPGTIGGHIGGEFDIAFAPQSTPVNITIKCKRVTKRGKNTSTTIIWQESMQAYVQQSNKGVNVRFLFKCPEDLPDSSSRSIFWEVSAESDLKMPSKLITFKRNWDIPVDDSGTSTSTVNIPEQFLQKQSEQKAQIAQADAADLIEFKQQGHFVDIDNIGERPIGASFGGILFGLIFFGSGLFTISQDWWPGYIFVLVGGLIVIASIFLLGRDIDVKVDNGARILYTRRKWFGITLYKREVMLFDPAQFSIEKTSSTSSEENLTEWYKIEVKNKDKKVLVAEGIKSKEVAKALMDKIIEQVFPKRF